MDVIKIKQTLLNQLNDKISDGLYYYTQINFAYNSNRIEGSILSEEQTKMIFNSDFSKELEIKNDDIIETQNHFKLFDYILKNADKELTIEMILEMHKILKSNTSGNDDAGTFKRLENVIGMINSIETVALDNVLNELENLLNKYKTIDNVTILDIINFHYQFEIIHPFNDEDEPLEQKATYLQKCLQNKGFTENSKSFFLQKFNKIYINC